MAIDFTEMAAKILRNTTIAPTDENARESADVMQRLVRAAADNPDLLAIAATKLKEAHEDAVRELLYGATWTGTLEVAPPSNARRQPGSKIWS